MKNIIKISFLAFVIFSCSEEEVPVKEIVAIEEVQIVKDPSNIEKITDPAAINELRNNLIKERLQQERLRLDSLPLAERLIAGDSLATDSIISLLTSENHSEIATFLNQLVQYKTRNFKLNNPAIETAILAQVNNPTIELQAIKYIGALNLNYHSTFLKKFNNGEGKYFDEYFYWLGRKGKKIEVLNTVSDQIKKGKLQKEKQKSIVFGLEQFANSHNKEIRIAAVEVLMLSYKKKIITAKEISSLKQEKDKSEKAKSFIKTVLRYGNESSKSIVSICLKNNIYVKEAFLNLTRNEDPRTKSMLLKQLSVKRSINQALNAVPIVYKKEKDSTIAIQLLKSIEKQGDYSPEKLELVFGTFKKMNALNWYKKADSFLKKKELIDGLKKFKEQPVFESDYDELATDLFNLGLVDSLTPTEIEEIESTGMYIDGNALLKNILNYSNKLLTIEKIAPESPINYFDLFSSFKTMFQTKLSNVEFVSKFENNEYSWIIIGDKVAIIAHPYNKEDKYDLKLFISILNQINSSSMSFNELSSDLQVVDVFLGTQSDLKTVQRFLKKAVN